MFDSINSLFGGEFLRVLATLMVIGAAIGANRLSVRYMSRKAEEGAHSYSERSRQRHVLIKNSVFLFAALAICTIWATLIAGVALSLAAVATALVISAKELIMCGSGYLLFTISRPYRVGDYVEVDGVSGRVIDVDLFCTTVSETVSSHQLSGRMTTFPNSVLLTKSVRNHSATGEYVIGMLPIYVPFEVNRDACEEVAQQAGNAVCEKWLKHADRHFQKIE